MMRFGGRLVFVFGGVVGKEVVLEEYGNLHQQFCVDAGLVEDAVGIAALVADGFGKVLHSPSHKQGTGVEPASAAWEAAVLPIY